MVFKKYIFRALKFLIDNISHTFTHACLIVPILRGIKDPTNIYILVLPSCSLLTEGPSQASALNTPGYGPGAWCHIWNVDFYRTCKSSF